MKEKGRKAGRGAFAVTGRPAIVREIKEELDCKVNPLVVIKPNRHSYPNLTSNFIPIVCELIEKTQDYSSKLLIHR